MVEFSIISRWTCGGFGIVYLLIPTQFTATLSEDSMFTTSFEVEQGFPAEEMDANSVFRNNRTVLICFFDDFAESKELQ